ncbi:MAG TPA: CxxC-x17-CxxC domain-containing protein [Candidatus Thermoplasmatota archaeon]|nr:CxxC-x17-CxxC domain-containing protein [Candidatus Thermoplasmatota archaeon]
MTTTTCAACGKSATVPFVPTPGRPVYCRDCFPKKRDASGPPRGPSSGGYGGGSGGRFGSSSSSYGSRDAQAQGGPARASPTQRRRMLRQGSKAHFRYDLRDVLSSTAMDENQKLSFSETVFSKGSRMSSEDAIEFVDSKVADQTITARDAQAIRNLILRYSMWR